jgi:hypothetical protein
MKFKPVLLVLLGFAVASTASADYCVNKDLINLGPTAYDLGVVLWGRQPITWHYDGYPSAHFNSYTPSFVGFNTRLHWQNVNGVNAPIPTGSLVHVGWCTPRRSNIYRMYWTDLFGRPINGSVVYNITAHAIYITCWGLRVQWINQFSPQFESGVPITIRNVSFAILPAPLPLADLNRENQVLNSQFQPLPGGETFTVEPGDTFDLPVPAGVPGQVLVLRYSVTGDSASADAMDFVQIPIEASAQQ